MQVVPKFSVYLRAAGLTALALGLGLATACANKVDRITIDKIIGTGMHHEDIERLCSVGDALGIPMGALGISKNALKAQVLADVSAALCVEPLVREAQLDREFARATLTGDAMVSGVLDARYREERAHTAAAYRYWRAWNNLEAEYGPVGADTCPRIKEKDELVYLMGLYAGIHGMLHDQAGGGHVGIPFDVLGKVARGSECLDNDRWWHVPGSFRAATWATLMNTEHGDPWALLDQEATAGEGSGLRLARAVHVMIAANADREEDLRKALTAHAASLKATPSDPNWAAMDKYAYDVSRHELDRLWAREKGHRAPAFGELPGAEDAKDTGPDPFGGDPFGEGANPFGDSGGKDESGTDAGSGAEDSTDSGEE